jgi:DNA primase small subunit
MDGKKSEVKAQSGKEPDARGQFIRKMFSRYYSSMKITPPAKLEQREFGVITERGGMWRHLGFKDTSELAEFLKKQVPLHAYHSSTYYSKPNARTMDEKGWLGADLIFDLDADHIQGTEKMTMEEMLAAVKVQFAKLIDSYLLGDFGFEEKDLRIVFSGGRGYHAHISHAKVLRLNSHERREIVDYITSTNPDIDKLIRKEIFETKSYQGHDTKKYTYRLYPKETPGWRGKVTASIFDFIERTERMTKEEILAELTEYRGIGDRLAIKIYENLYPGKSGNRGVDKIMRDLNLEAFKEDSVRNSFINYILREMSVQLGGETDEPVTSDTKRLIRLPGSLHGKTSLRVITLATSELKGFLPLRDAVWDGFTDDPLRVRASNDVTVVLKGNTFKLTKDVESGLPEYAALFYVCQKKCDILI